MSNIRTHYDVLNVSRNASIEVIRAAYKTLSQKYHPDKYIHENDKLKANQVMSILNNAYQVLSNPLQRYEYDEWLAMQEAKQSTAKSDSKRITVSIDYGNVAVSTKSYGKKFFNNLQTKWQIFSRFVRELFLGILRLAIPFAILGILASILIPMFSKEPEPLAMPNPIAETNLSYEPKNSSEKVQPAIKTKKLQRKAPNGKPFPNRPLYVEGYPKLNTDGLSTITVDNTQNDSDIFGKLYYLDRGQPQAVRYFFIPAHGGFIMRNVTKGNYDIRYKDLSDGQIAKSETFEVQEIEDTTGTQFSNLTMTLYKVANGNMQTTPIPESEF